MSTVKKNCTILCKIAELSKESDDEIFEYMETKWKLFGNLHRSDINKILDPSNIHRGTDFKVISQDDALYLIHKNENRSGQYKYYVQEILFPIVFKNFRIENDLSIRLGTKESGEQQSLRTIKKFATIKLYEALFVAHQRFASSVEDKRDDKLELPSNFLPTLCRYQERTVRWLLKREKSSSFLRSHFVRLDANDGITTVYKNRLFTQFESVEPSAIELPPGGILAEEMGLGKTVEMLALILLHQRNNEMKICLNTNEEDIPIPMKKPRRTKELFCICNGKNMKNTIECTICEIAQHERCVCKHNRGHSNDINEPYICPQCWRNYIETKGRIESGATLIVTPNTIKNQWVDEIHRHISPNLRVHVYDGIANGDWISPRQLSDYDIVVTDYTILKKEVFHTSSHDSDRVMRHKPRSMRLYTPLLMIDWFRVCLDEAQMVESDASQMAALVRKIPAVNRWAVTGTPIARSIDDLYPLLRFIGLEDSINPAEWDTLVKDFMLNYEDDNVEKRSSLLLVETLQNLMWRTCKDQVLDELPIPEQNEITHRLVLSDLERLFYTEQHEECKLDFNKTLHKYMESTDSLLSTSHQTIKIIMKPLLKIRQCCIIPVVSTIRTAAAAANVLQKQFLQPKELHAHLKLKNENECKTELRSMASSFNGCAVIHFLKGNYHKALKNYESVLKLARDYGNEKNLSVDSLLQIHALYNILELRNVSKEIASEIDADKMKNYETQLNDLEWKYLETYASQMVRMETAFHTISQTLKANMENLDDGLLDFLSILLNFDDTNLQNTLLAKILGECMRRFGSMRLEAATSLRGILLMIVSWYDKLIKDYEKILKSFSALSFYTSNVKPRSQVSDEGWSKMSAFIGTVYDCHLMELRRLKNDSDDETKDTESTSRHNISRKGKNKKQNLCDLCKMRDLLNNFECLLFKKSIDVRTNVLEGDENPQMEIEFIKIIFNSLKPKYPSYASKMDQHYQVIQNMQNFCKKAIKYWIEIEFTVKAFDELNMCKMRISTSDDEDEKSMYKINTYELDTVYAEQKANLNEAQRNFATKLARLNYIKHLESSTDKGPCPICQSEDEVRHIVLECGHQLCLSCYKDFRQYNPGCSLTCSICRNVQNTHRVYFVTCLANKSSNDDYQLDVVGDYSSKITYIIQLVLKLKLDHQDRRRSDVDKDDFPLKILIFSQWPLILQALANAFYQNGITYYLLHSSYHYVRTIENFKDPTMGNITCLLMPLSKGSKGLNLIEATHVFLVEPILNPSEEQQAIGRVHRFGQTRPTTVHRFIVDGTIEENIYKVVAAGKESENNWEFDKMTSENLMKLFELANNETDTFNQSITH